VAFGAATSIYAGLRRIARQELQYPFDGRNEAHIEHSIRLVEHQAAHCTQIDRALIRKIEEPTGSCDQQIAAGAQVRDLRLDIDAAKDDLGAKLQILPVAARALGNLGCKLACRRQHERPRCARGRRG
jgi:hypothetical protein